ncbi:MAG: hypothetical protein ABL958_17715 [Bdellovibrionia bacterium]
MRNFLVALILLFPLASTAALGQRCYRLSPKKAFNQKDNRLPLLCVKQDQRQFKDKKTRLITVQRRIGKNGSGIGEYVAHVKFQPKCRSCNKTSYKLMNVPYDSPYLTFNGHHARSGERGYLVFRGEGYFYRSTN